MNKKAIYTWKEERIYRRHKRTIIFGISIEGKKIIVKHKRERI